MQNLFNNIPIVSFCWYCDGDCNGIVTFQYIYLHILILFLYSHFVGQSGVIKRNFDLFADGNIQRVIHRDESFLFQ